MLDASLQLICVARFLVVLNSFNFLSATIIGDVFIQDVLGTL